MNKIIFVTENQFNGKKSLGIGTMDDIRRINTSFYMTTGENLQFVKCLREVDENKLWKMYFFLKYSLEFDGADDYLSLGNISSLSSASAFTLSTWVKTSTTNKFIYASYASGITDSIQMYFHSGGSLRCIVGTGSSWYQIGTSSTTLADGTWKNFTFVFSGGNYLKIYVNGSEETTSFVNGTNTVPTTTVANAGNTPRIADSVTGGSSLNGLVDEVALFNTALSASQITNIYRGEDDGGSGGTNGVPGDLSTFNPVGWWRMGDNNVGSGTTITDQGSGGNNGTIVNGTQGNTTPTYSTSVPS